MIGLAEAGGDGLDLAKEIYAKALEKRDALCAPYAAVIDIDPEQIAVAQRGARLVGGTVRLGAAARSRLPGLQPAPAATDPRRLQDRRADGRRYLKMLEACEPTIAKNVTGNLYERHLKPLFVGSAAVQR